MPTFTPPKLGNVQEAGAWSTFQQHFQRYAVLTKSAFICHSEATKIRAPEGENADALKTQANATMYEALKASVDEVTFTAIVDNETELDYDADALYKKFATYAQGPIAALVGADLQQAVWGWPWPHAAGTMVDQVQTAIKELKTFKTRSDALGDDQTAYKTTEKALTLLFRAKMPLAMQIFEPRYRAFDSFTQLLNEGCRDASNIDSHPERFAVLAVSACGGARAATDDANDNLGQHTVQVCNLCGAAKHKVQNCPSLDKADRELIQQMMSKAKLPPLELCRMDEHGVYHKVSNYDNSPRSGGGAVT